MRKLPSLRAFWSTPARDTGLRNVSIVFAWDVAAKVLLALAALTLIRVLTVEEYARFTTSMAVATLCSQAVSQTLNRLYIVGEDRIAAGDVIASFLAVNFVLVAGGTLLTTILIGWRSYSFLVVLAVALATSGANFAKTASQRELRFGALSVLELGRSVGYFLLLVLFLWVSPPSWVSADSVIAIQAICMGAAAAISMAADRRTIWPPQGRQVAVILGEVLRGPYTALAAYLVVLSFLGQLVLLLMGRLTTTDQLAAYGTSGRYYGLMILALGATHTVLLPTIHKARMEGRVGAETAKQLRQLLVLLPLLVVATVVCSWAIPLVDGGRYPSAVPAFQILAASAAFSLVLSPYSSVLISAERFKFLLSALLGAVVIALFLTLVLVPAHGAVGGAIAHGVAFTVLNTLTWLGARRELRGRGG